MRGILEHNKPLAEFTSWRVGGPGRQVYQPADLDDLSEFLATLSPEEPILWLGLGSNTLIRDQGYAGTVIVTQGHLKELSQVGPQQVRAEAGVSCAQAARYCARLDLTGVEFLAGVPGTIGGALAMNAGCFGGETWPHVAWVETMNRRGERRQRQPSEYQIAYRTVQTYPDEWFVAAVFNLQPGDKTIALATIRELLDRRAATQPTGDPSCGSVFKNPPNDYSARLIEACGLKGHRIGGAIVSPKHANFIINEDNATAKDIEALIAHVQATVKQQHGISLEHEVRIIGEV